MSVRVQCISGCVQVNGIAHLAGGDPFDLDTAEAFRLQDSGIVLVLPPDICDVPEASGVAAAPEVSARRKRK